MSHVDFKKCPCRPVEYKGQEPLQNILSKLTFWLVRHQQGRLCRKMIDPASVILALGFSKDKLVNDISRYNHSAVITKSLLVTKNHSGEVLTFDRTFGKSTEISGGYPSQFTNQFSKIFGPDLKLSAIGRRTGVSFKH